MVEKSLQLQWLEKLNDRCQLDSWMTNRLNRSRLGHKGESDFEDMINRYIPEDWILLHDLTFKRANKHLQIDFILVTPHGLYVFEVKNFSTYFEYLSNRLVGENGVVFSNIFYQVDKGREFLKDNLRLHYPIEGQLILMAEQDTVDFHNQCDGMYLKRWQLEKYFQKIKGNQQKILDVKRITKYIREQSIPSHYGIEFEGKEWVNRARKGIICDSCKSTHWERYSRQRVKCQNCNLIEDYKKAITRTIMDYKILYYFDEFSIKNVFKFMNGRVKYTTLLMTYKELERNGQI